MIQDVIQAGVNENTNKIQHKIGLSNNVVRKSTAKEQKQLDETHNNQV